MTSATVHQAAAPPHGTGRPARPRLLPMLPLLRPLLALCIGLAVLNPTAQAATAAEEARMKQCPEGDYGGPGTGATRFYQDPYVWFVSRDFARRFCMPERFIDDTLTGALAVAVRLKPEEFALCGMFMARSDQCSAKQRLLMDVYIDNTKANIPKADPSVRFYMEWPHSSGFLLGPEGSPRREMRRRGEMPDVEGERRPFSPAHSKTVNEKTWTYFLYLGARKGWATGAGNFIETYYRADWIKGVDIITLDISDNMGFQTQRNPDEQIQTNRRSGRGYPDERHDVHNPIRRWVIGVISGSEYFSEKYNNVRDIAYPKGYSHVIELPHPVAKIFYEYDWKQGANFFESIRRAMESPNTTGR
jgi:hypothetical protein